MTNPVVLGRLRALRTLQEERLIQEAAVLQRRLRTLSEEVMAAGETLLQVRNEAARAEHARQQALCAMPQALEALREMFGKRAEDNARVMAQGEALEAAQRRKEIARHNLEANARKLALTRQKGAKLKEILEILARQADIHAELVLD